MPGLACLLRMILFASVHFIVVSLVSGPAEVKMTPGLIGHSQADMAAAALSLQLCSCSLQSALNWGHAPGSPSLLLVAGFP